MSKIAKLIVTQHPPQGVVDNKIMQFRDQCPQIERAWLSKFINSLVHSKDPLAILQKRRRSRLRLEKADRELGYTS